MKRNGKIQLSRWFGRGDERADAKIFTLEIEDQESTIRFLTVHISAPELALALLGHQQSDCEYEIRGVDKLGKTHECKNFVCEMPAHTWNNKREKAIAAMTKACPEGWVFDAGFNSQDSFFKDGKKDMCRTYIRRWVDKGESK